MNQSEALPASTVTVRSSQNADFPAITDIYAHHVLHGLATFEIEPPTLAEMTRRQNKLRADGFPSLVAILDNRVVGYAYAGPYRARPAYRFTVEDTVYLHTDFIGRRIGSVLLDSLLHESTSRRFRQMVAVIGDSGNRASIRMHTRAGFTVIGVLRSVGFKHGRWVDSVLMQRALGEGDTSTA